MILRYFLRSPSTAATASRLLLRPGVSSFATTTMPSPPYQYRLPDAAPFDISDLATKISELEEKRQGAYDLSRKLQVALVQAQTKVSEDPIETTSLETLESLLKDNTADIPPTADRVPRPANLSSRIEDYVRLLAYKHFLLTGTLVPAPAIATDEEYLAGACMGLCQDLSRYGLGRATARDADSVRQATDLVEAILNFLLELDFRNGPLRRRYDGTKYCLKSLETLLYEMAVTGTEPPTKKLKSELIPEADLQALKGHMEHGDNLEETLIKKCRDGQKAAKQSIFALHRGDKDKAQQLLKQCHDCILADLLPIVQEEPPLRGGSFSNVLEEYAEAKLFMAWLHGKEDNGDATSGLLLKPEDFEEAGISLEPEEYIGGLCDLTGELGREAVKRGTARDVDGVKLCLQTNMNIYTALQTMERLPGGTGKKINAVRNSVEKLQRMLYEMSLSEAAGGRNIETSIKMEEVEEK